MHANTPTSTRPLFNLTRPRTAWGACGLLLFSAITLWACSVPVFRYALERWPSDPYQAVLFHHGPLTQETSELLKPFMPAGNFTNQPSPANLQIQSVNLQEDNLDPALLRLWDTVRPPDSSTPWITLLYPFGSGLGQPVWSGPFQNSAIQELIDSPLRQSIGQQLAAGASAVWVMLENADSFANDTAFELLQKRLAHLESNLELEELDQADIDQGLVSVPQDQLHIKFPLVRLSRDNPQELRFVDMLLGLEPDLRSLPGPMAFPIFGRGRALYTLVGPGINHETIDDAAQFLIGPCSCQVKELNPGVDLLMNIDWNNLVESSIDQNQELPPLSGFAALPQPPTESSAPPVLTPKDPTQSSTTLEDENLTIPPTTSSSMFRRILLLGSVVFLAVIGLTALIFFKKG